MRANPVPVEELILPGGCARMRDPPGGPVETGWKSRLEAEARRQGMTLDGYLSCRFPHSALAGELLREVIEAIRKG